MKSVDDTEDEEEPRRVESLKYSQRKILRGKRRIPPAARMTQTEDEYATEQVSETDSEVEIVRGTQSPGRKVAPPSGMVTRSQKKKVNLRSKRKRHADYNSECCTGQPSGALAEAYAQFQQ